MKTVRDIQSERARALYYRLVRYRNELPSSSKLRRMNTEILNSTSTLPLCGQYRLSSHTAVDLDSLNAELGLVGIDAETALSYVTLLSEWLQNAEFVTTVWSQFCICRNADLSRDIVRYTANMYIDGFTEDIDISAVADAANTSLSVGDDGSISLLPVASSRRNGTYTLKDVSIRKIGPDNFVARILGNRISPIQTETSEGLRLILEGDHTESVGFLYEWRAAVSGVNQLSIRIGEESVGIRVVVDVSETGSAYQTCFDHVVTRTAIDVPLPFDTVEVVRVYLMMSNPNVQFVDSCNYEFRLYRIVAVRSSKQRSGTLITTKIPIESDVASLSLVADASEYNGATISYYIATETDGNGLPIGFVAVGTDNSVINMSASTAHLVVSTGAATNPWNITPSRVMGSNLYSLLDIGCDTESTDYVITDGAITFSDTKFALVNDSVRLYRGSGDYVKQTKTFELDKHVSAAAVDVSVNVATRWVNPVHMVLEHRILIEEANIGTTGTQYRNYIRVPWRIESADSIKIEREDGYEVSAMISNVSYSLSYEPEDGVGLLHSIPTYTENYTDVPVDSTYITLSGTRGEIILDEAYHYYVSFTTRVAEYVLERESMVTVHPGTVTVTCGGVELVRGVDYRVKADTYVIELLKSGGYQHNVSFTTVGDDTVGMSTPITLSFDFTERRSRDVTYYETYINVVVPTDVVIIPFNAAERTAGNFHSINDTDVSSERSYTLKQGWNHVQTTQPYPSVNEYDVNSLTGERSNAGIVIPETINAMRPYLDSMRRVSPFRLITMNPEESAKCFALENSTIYINFLPDSVDQTMVTDYTHTGTTGNVLYCKKPTWDVDYSNAAWVAHPEEFDLEFTYTDEEHERFVFVKVVIESTEDNSFARVNRIGLNKYRTIQ